MEPIDYNSPLGVGKREWAKVLGVNLALLILVYAIALICTLCGSNLFLLNFSNPNLDAIETFLREHGAFSFLTIAFTTIEETIICCYVAKRKPNVWLPLVHYATTCLFVFILNQCLGYLPSFFITLYGILYVAFAVFLLNGFKGVTRRYLIICLIRLAIALAITFSLNGIIVVMRNKIGELFKFIDNNSVFFALSLEYDLALSLAFGFLTMVIPWDKKGGTKQCQTPLQGVGGSSPSSTNSSPKSSKIAKTNLPPKYRKRLRWLKAKVIVIQTVALIVIAALPWFTGRPVEFALVYASFCMTRLMLGFNRSLHFKSELSCVTIGALCFWALTFLTPSVEVLIILSLCYGACLALGFRLWWELHDLMMYHKAAKTDRYAMLYVVFKGNCDPKHINGVMRAKGYTDNDEIKIVQLYMAKEKVEYIAHYMTFAKITIEKKLTEIATNLYLNR